MAYRTPSTAKASSACRHERRRAADPAAPVEDLIRRLPDGVDVVPGDRGADELHRLRQPRPVAPLARLGIEDRDLVQDLLAAPAADHPQLALVGHDTERMRGPREPVARRQRSEPGS